MRVLSRQALGRALLARNLLLERSGDGVVRAVEHLIGLQAQEPQEPYVGLFARLAHFDPKALSEAIEQRILVRTLMMRRTLHLMTAEDCLGWRSAHQGMLEQRMRSVLRRRLVGVDEQALADLARPLLLERPRTLREVGRLVNERWPDVAPGDLGDALSSLLPLVQVPPRGLWRQSGPARHALMSAWLGDEVGPPAEPDGLVLRYLAAFGPATSTDFRAWSGLGGLKQVLERLMPRLRTFRDERGRLLLDLPEGPLPDAAVPAPPRFLPAFDNAVLGYADRSRIIDDEHRGLSVSGARLLLVDGRVAATWSLDLRGSVAELNIAPLGDLQRSDPIDEEALRLLAFLAPEDSQHRLTWAQPR